MSKTIIHVIDALTIGGAESLLLGVVNSLNDYDHVVVTLLSKNQYVHLCSNVTVISLNYRNKLSLFRAIRSLKKIIRDYDPCIIHAHLLSASFLTRLAKPRGLPMIFTVHNLLSKSAFLVSRISKFLELASYKKNQTVLFVSNEVKRDYERTIGIKGESHVLYNFIDPLFFDISKNNYEIEGTVKLIAVGSLKKQKNYDFLIDSLSNWQRKDFTLDIYGEGELKFELQNKIDRYKLGNKIKLKGSAPNMFNILKNYDLYVLGSIYEGFGLSPVEAMAVGLPTLISDIEILHEVSDGASLFNPINQNSLIEGLESYINSKMLRELKAKEGLERAKIIGNRESHLKGLKDIYSKKCQ